MEIQVTPKSLIEMVRYFSDADVCIEFVASLRWLQGTTCPHCDSKNVGFLKTRRIWKCRVCRKQFSVKTGTIFEESPISLDKWLMAIWLVVNCKNGVSSYEIARDLEVTQKSAWFMLHRIRLALRSGSWRKLGSDGGPVEVDETFIGGKSKNMHEWKRKAKGITGSGSKQGKIIVQGILERGSRVKVEIVPDRKKKTLQTSIKKHVAKGSELFTDELRSYSGLDKDYLHEVINHAEEYVRGKVHTNGMENFWSLLKRGLGGTYISVEPFHLDRYLDEQMFRFNNRATRDNPLDDADRFMLAVSQISGKRLTYAELTGKVEETAQF